MTDAKPADSQPTADGMGDREKRPVAEVLAALEVKAETD